MAGPVDPNAHIGRINLSSNRRHGIAVEATRFALLDHRKRLGMIDPRDCCTAMGEQSRAKKESAGLGLISYNAGGDQRGCLKRDSATDTQSNTVDELETDMLYDRQDDGDC